MQPCKRRVRSPPGSPPAQGRSPPEQAQSEKSQGVRGTASPDSSINTKENRELRVRFFGGTTSGSWPCPKGFPSRSSFAVVTPELNDACPSAELPPCGPQNPSPATILLASEYPWPPPIRSACSSSSQAGNARTLNAITIFRPTLILWISNI